jgi:hypothetical protein
MKTNVEWRNGAVRIRYTASRDLAREVSRMGMLLGTQEQFLQVGAPDWPDFSRSLATYGMPKGPALRSVAAQGG